MFGNPCRRRNYRYIQFESFHLYEIRRNNTTHGTAIEIIDFGEIENDETIRNYMREVTTQNLID